MPNLRKRQGGNGPLAIRNMKVRSPLTNGAKRRSIFN
ncbi:MAG: hypothetical protein QG657_5429 [Acidobacteriota bacterium]|nr:hypothetical protein [Acidobacteriota bacterium]